MRNTHIPPNDKKMIKQIDLELQSHIKRLFILFGDFNLR